MDNTGIRRMLEENGKLRLEIKSQKKSEMEFIDLLLRCPEAEFPTGKSRLFIIISKLMLKDRKSLLEKESK